MIHGFQLMEPPPYRRCLHFVGTPFYRRIFFKNIRENTKTIKNANQNGGAKGERQSKLDTRARDRPDPAPSTQHEPQPGSAVCRQTRGTHDKPDRLPTTMTRLITSTSHWSTQSVKLTAVLQLSRIATAVPLRNGTRRLTVAQKQRL